ncbi:MAG TPA: hypothetical protein VMW95_00090 [Desulfobacterales bacterium]|nr:hypothetical protein [Desulfobacterales bacterium]
MACLDRHFYAFIITFNALAFTFSKPFKSIDLEWRTDGDCKYLKIDYELKCNDSEAAI